jgi:DNA polymerase III delta prime subunit
MDKLDFNTLLNRNKIVETIKNILQQFQENKTDLLQKRGLYVYGEPGSGKTLFITKTLQMLGYDIIRYDAGDIRNKNIIETITKNNTAEKSVISMFSAKSKPIAIVMDEIDGMSSGDKGGINTLIKLIRPKKTKKQRLEVTTNNPIICISNHHIDKKIRELMKVCYVIELKIPTSIQMKTIAATLMPKLSKSKISIATRYFQGDLRKLSTLYTLYMKEPKNITNDIFRIMLHSKFHTEDPKDTTKLLLNTNLSLSQHSTTINETERTIVGLLWHENITDMLSKQLYQQAIPFYSHILENICYADYIDRITFQKQIWQFNEMSSLIKVMYPNKLYHDTFKKKPYYNPIEVRFTKVLTKYSTEYNNSIFIQFLCQQLGMDKKDILAFFLFLREKYSNEDIYLMLERYNITSLDINRIYRYIAHYTNIGA